MSGHIKTHVQLGDSNTPANNFVLTSQAADGSMKLARGNFNATSQDLITVSPTNVITGAPGATLVGNGPAYTASFSAVGTGTGTALLQLTEELDPTNAYSAGVFTPQVAGYYQFSANYQLSATTCAYVALQLKKNGTIVATVVAPGYVTAYGSCSLSALIYMNGTTDSMTLHQDISTTGVTTITSCRAGCFLARAA